MQTLKTPNHNSTGATWIQAQPHELVTEIRKSGQANHTARNAETLRPANEECRTGANQVYCAIQPAKRPHRSSDCHLTPALADRIFFCCLGAVSCYVPTNPVRLLLTAVLQAQSQPTTDEMAIRDDENALWDSHKAIIRKLYMEQKTPLKDVIGIMTGEHNFVRK
jgi:hypothetical protein